MPRIKLAPIADTITSGIRAKMSDGQSLPSWEEIRDECDVRTGGELDYKKLDILADMVKSRLEKQT